MTTAPIPVRAEDPFSGLSDAEAALERFHAQWPPERCQRLGRLIDGDCSDVLAEALSPKETDTPADAAVRRLSDAELSDLSRGQRKFQRERRAGGRA